MTNHDESLHPRNDLKQFTDKIQGAPGFALPTPSTTETVLEAANIRAAAADRTIVLASGKLAADYILAQLPDAKYLEFSVSDQGEDSGLWPVAVLNESGEEISDTDDFGDDVSEALQNMPQTTQWTIGDDGQVEASYAQWLDFSYDRIDLQEAAKFDCADPHATLTEAYTAAGEAGRAVIAGTGKLAAERVLESFPDAAYIQFEVSDQGSYSGLWAVGVVDADGVELSDLEDHQDSIGSLLSALPQESPTYWDANDVAYSPFDAWLDYDGERIDVIKASKLSIV